MRILATIAASALAVTMSAASASEEVFPVFPSTTAGVASAFLAQDDECLAEHGSKCGLQAVQLRSQKLSEASFTLGHEKLLESEEVSEIEQHDAQNQCGLAGADCGPGQPRCCGGVRCMTSEQSQGYGICKR